MYGLTEVIFNRMSPLNAYSARQQAKILDSLTRSSPVLFCENSLETGSESATVETHATVPETQKLTAWIQSTINKLTITILSHRQGLKTELALYKELPDLKLVFDAEDIVSSLDFQNVYLKIKSKIGSASIQHYER